MSTNTTITHQDIARAIEASASMLPKYMSHASSSTSNSGSNAGSPKNNLSNNDTDWYHQPPPPPPSPVSFPASLAGGSEVHQ